MDHVKKNPDHVDLLEDLTATGTWYLDLKTMTFTEMSEKNYEIYGISKDKPSRYEHFLFDCILLKDQTCAEKQRMEFLLRKRLQFLFESRTVKVGELGCVRIAFGFWM